jgi:hypothetical protein
MMFGPETKPMSWGEASQWLLVLLFSAMVTGIAVGNYYFGAHP